MRLRNNAKSTFFFLIIFHHFYFFHSSSYYGPYNSNYFTDRSFTNVNDNYRYLDEAGGKEDSMAAAAVAQGAAAAAGTLGIVIACDLKHPYSCEDARCEVSLSCTVVLQLCKQ